MVPEPPKYSYDPNSASKVFDNQRQIKTSDALIGLLIVVIAVSIVAYAFYSLIKWGW